MVLFSALAVLAYEHDTKTQAHLGQLVDQASSVSVAKQKQQDDAVNNKLNESPYRAYTANPVDGGFQLQIPKNWSIYSAHSDLSSTQLDLMADPNAVATNLSQTSQNAHGLHIQLLNTSLSDVNKRLEGNLKENTVTSKGTTVSGIAATWFEGTIDDQRHNGIMITLPVRDKTMTISTETRAHLDEFNAIVAAAKINP